MKDLKKFASIAEMPAQRAAAPASKAEARARYFNTGNAFDVRLSAVPDQIFVAEPAQALHPDSPTGLFTCDNSAALGCQFPATSPLVLARYARIRAGEALSTDFIASSIIVYVIAGQGTTVSGNADDISWAAGDIIVLPGGVEYNHRATSNEPAILWIVTNEPQLAFENLRPPEPGASGVEAVHYPAEEMKRQIDLIYEVGRDETIAGSALILSSDSPEAEARRNALPTLTIALNSLEPGTVQRSHRHNAVAISLIIEGDRCFSMIDGKRKDWAQWATTVTPPGSFHSHHNEGVKRAFFLIIQDGGLFYHTRAMGFAYEDE